MVRGDIFWKIYIDGISQTKSCKKPFFYGLFNVTFKYVVKQIDKKIQAMATY